MMTSIEQGYYTKEAAKFYTNLSQRTLEYAVSEGKLRAFKVYDQRHEELLKNSSTYQETYAQLLAASEQEPPPATDWGELDEEKDSSTRKKSSSPWARAIDAPSFLAQEEKDFQGLAKHLLVRCAIALLAAPRGLGKTLFAHALAVILATGGTFRGEHVQAVRVLLVDRDNPKSVIKKRLWGWGARGATNLYVLTREDAPDLRDKKAWRDFPADQYDGADARISPGQPDLRGGESQSGAGREVAVG